MLLHLAGTTNFYALDTWCVYTNFIIPPGDNNLGKYVILLIFTVENTGRFPYILLFLTTYLFHHFKLLQMINYADQF